MLKNTVLFVSGIVRKQAVEHEQINDFQTYILQQDLNNLESSYSPEEQERYRKYLQLFVEIDDHLFPICNLNQIELLKEYSKSKLMNELKENFDKSIENKKCNNLGMAQYLGRVKELEECKQYQENKKTEERKERERIEKEKEMQKQKEWNLELDAAETKFKNGEKINSEYFVGLLERYDIKLPLRTKGWAMNSLAMICKDSYNYYGNASKVIMDYAEELYNLISDNKEDQDNILDIFSFEGVTI